MPPGARFQISSSEPNSATCPAGTPKKAAEHSALRCRKANSRHQALAELLQDLALPRLGAAVIGQGRAGLAPRDGEAHIAQRIPAELADLLDERVFRGGGLDPSTHT